MIRRVTSQVEFDAAIAAQDEIEIADDLRLEIGGSHRPIIRTIGKSLLRLIAWESSQPHVVAWGSSQPHVVARESSQPHVVARESSQPHVVARESSQPHVVARESSQPHVVAWESSQPHVVAWGSSQPHVVARESSQPHVVAWGSSQPHVVAWGSSQPHVEARESSQPHVVAWGSSQPHVEARGSSQPHVVARGICQLAIRGAVKVVAAATVAIMILGGTPKIEGGGFIQRVDISTPQKWCDYYGATVTNGVAILFKVVDRDFMTPQRRFPYVPGTQPEALDWDGGQQECGKGLHFSPTPIHALQFDEGLSRAQRRFVACPVALDGLAVHPDGSYPAKVKAKGLAGPCWEVDLYGKPVAGAVVWTPPSPPAEVVAGKKAKSPAKRRPKAAAKRRGGK